MSPRQQISCLLTHTVSLIMPPCQSVTLWGPCDKEPSPKLHSHPPSSGFLSCCSHPPGSTGWTVTYGNPPASASSDRSASMPSYVCELCCIWRCGIVEAVVWSGTCMPVRLHEVVQDSLWLFFSGGHRLLTHRFCHSDPTMATSSS